MQVCMQTSLDDITIKQNCTISIVESQTSENRMNSGRQALHFCATEKHKTHHDDLKKFA